MSSPRTLRNQSPGDERRAPAGEMAMQVVDSPRADAEEPYRTGETSRTHVKVTQSEKPQVREGMPS